MTLDKTIRDRSIESIAGRTNPLGEENGWDGIVSLAPPLLLVRGKCIYRERDRGIREQYDQPQATPGRTLFIAQQFTTNKNRVYETRAQQREKEKFWIEMRMNIVGE